MSFPYSDRRYDVVIAGARVAGSATALLLARSGLRVLVVDPVGRGRDTLSTHALMRGGVLQLARWGLLDAVRASGAPRLTRTTFHYGEERIAVDIDPDGEIDGLYAPRRTVIDSILAEAAEDAGAEFRYGWSVDDLGTSPNGHVTHAIVRNAEGDRHPIRADVVVGADGARSKVARLTGARATRTAPHATASIYGYFERMPSDGCHWHFADGLAAGVIPTNDGQACVFVSMPPSRLLENKSAGLERVFLDVLRSVSPDLFLRAASAELPSLRGFAGAPSMLRESAGPGWALVGDAGYFKDPLTAHGMTDALRDAELLARAIVAGREGSGTMDDALLAYEETRDRLSQGLLDVTSRIASLEWDLEEVKQLHRTLSREMKEEVIRMREWDRLRPAA
jgi:2-polyprenyl-6-methoxyphenol hydroxylase-like FAD-dependent oxidoreductase